MPGTDDSEDLPLVAIGLYLERESATGEVEYVMTTRGPEPTLHRSAPLDHDHYVTKQLAPVCDVVFPLLSTSFARIAGAQTSLF